MMQTFIQNERLQPQKKDVLSRIKNFNEVYNVFGTNKAGNQASRCVQCGDPYCSADGCPLSNYIPHWLKSIASSDVDMAFKLSNESSPFPEILGRICPQDKLCEGSCTLGVDGFGAVSIGAIEVSITEHGLENGAKFTFPKLKTEKKVAIIGSGPAGLSCATFLMRAGVGVEMFERDNKAGGLLTYGIPGFKLDKEVVQRRFDILTKAGMKLHLNCEIGKDISMDKLKNDFDFIYIGTGASKSNSIKIENESAVNVFNAIDFLRDIQKELFKENSNKIELENKKVVVIGGGDTAMDCIRTSIRKGAKNVTCVYRRDEANMPGSKKEYLNAIEEGAEFEFLASPKALNGDSNIVTSIKFIKTELTEPDKSGRQSVKEINGSDFEIEADIIINALGFSHQDMPYAQGLELNRWGGLVVNKNFQTSNENIYSGGDCVNGADLAVTAARDGRDAAIHIAKRVL